MGLDGINFDAKFKAYESYIKTNKEHLGLKGSQIGEQLGRYTVAFQHDATKADNLKFGKEFAREKAIERGPVQRQPRGPVGLTAKQINEQLGIGKAKSYRQVQQYAKEFEQLLAETDRAAALKNAEAISKKVKVTAADIDARLGIGKKLLEGADRSKYIADLEKILPESKPVKPGFLPKAGKMFKGKGGKLAALVGLAAAVGAGIYALTNKKSELPKDEKKVDELTEKLNEVKDSLATVPAGEQEKVKEEGKKETAKDETVQDKTVKNEVVKENDKKQEAAKTAEETEVAEENKDKQETVETTEEVEVPAPAVTFKGKEDVQVVKLEGNKGKVENKPAVEVLDEEPVDDAALEARIRNNKAENKKLRAELRDARKHQRLEHRLENLERRKEQQILRETRQAEQRALRDSAREIKAGDDTAKLEQLNQRQTIRDIRRKGRQQIREIRFQTRKEILEYKLSQTA